MAEPVDPHAERSPDLTAPDRHDRFKEFLSRDLGSIVILFIGRSGSTFVAGLLDGHSQILSLPKGAVRRGDRSLVEYVVDECAGNPAITPAKLARGALSRAWWPPKDDPDPEKTAVLRENLTATLALLEWPPEPSQALRAIYFCGAETSGLDTSIVRYLLVNLHFHEALEGSRPFLEEHLSPLRVLYTTKDPRSSFLSELRRKPRSFLIDSNGLYRSFRGADAYDLYDKYRHCSYMLKNERLNAQPREEMARLSTWLGVDFEEQLLQCTLMGQPWSAVPSSRPGGVRGDQFSSAHNKEEVLDRHDRIYLELMYFRMCRDLGYPLTYVDSAGSLLRHGSVIIRRALNLGSKSYPMLRSWEHFRQNFDNFWTRQFCVEVTQPRTTTTSRMVHFVRLRREQLGWSILARGFVALRVAWIFVRPLPRDFLQVRLFYPLYRWMRNLRDAWSTENRSRGSRTAPEATGQETRN